MRTILFSMSLLLACTACESAKEKALEAATGAKVDMKGNTITVKDKDGKTVTAVMGEEGGKGVAHITDGEGNSATFGGEVPRDFPLPIFEGATVGMAAKSDKGDEGTAYSVTLMIEKKSPTDVAAFYEKALNDKGLKVTKSSMNMGDKTMVQLAGKSDTVKAAVVVNPGDDDGSAVMLSWTAKK